MNAEDTSPTRERLEAWLAEVPLAPAPDPSALLPGAIDLATAELVFSMLAWEAGVPQAVSAARRLAGAFVDANEMRVALVDEIEDTIGLTDARAGARARMVVQTLSHVFETEDAVSIDRLARRGALDARAYLMGIAGLPPFVVDRVLLLAIGEPCVPIDERLRGVLIDRGIVDKHDDAGRASRLLAACCPGNQAKGMYLRLEAASSRQSMGAGWGCG